MVRKGDRWHKALGESRGKKAPGKKGRRLTRGRVYFITFLAYVFIY
jgi:hypothetical protein